MKKRKCILFILLFCMILNGNAFAAPELMLPFSSGRSIKVTQGNNACSDDSCTHSSINSMVYAFDFAGTGCEGKPIHASAAGIIQKVESSVGWGNVVVINYGDGTYGRYAHLNNFANGLNEGDQVAQGELIGYCGSTGYSTAAHLHYQTEDANGQSIESTFIDVPLNGGIPQELDIITSANDYNEHNNFRVGKFADGWKFQDTSSQYFIPYTKPFSVSYHWHSIDENGMESGLFGYPISEVYKYPSDLNWDPLGADQVWVQDFNLNGNTYTLILNPYVYNIRFDYLGVAYPIHGQLRSYWQANFAFLGAPVTDEYYWPAGTTDYVVQWFEVSDNQYVSVAYQTSTGDFYVDKPEIPQDANYFNQSAENNAGCPNGDCGVGGSGYGDVSPFPPPTNLVANPLSSSRIEVRWDLVSDAVDYQVKIYTHSSGTLVNTLNDTDGSVIFDNLTSNTAYELEVKAIYLDGESSWTSRVVTSTLAPSQVSLESAELLTCESVQNLACVNPKSLFPYFLSSAHVYLKLANPYTDPLYFRFDVFDPVGNLAESLDRYGNYSSNPATEWVTYAGLTGAVQGVSSRTGLWRIDINYGYDINSINNFYTTYYFSVDEIPPPPADVPSITTEVIW